MEKLFLWYNPKYNCFIEKWCRSYVSPSQIGSYNSFGHVLVEVYEKRDNTLKKILTISEIRQRYMSTKRSNKRENRLLNIFKKE